MGKEWKNKVSDFIFGDSKITADGDCCHEIKRRLLLGRKVITNLDRILKSGDITLPTKVCLVKAMVFPVVMYGYESWTVKKAEHRRIEAFELWCWRRLLRVPWTARRPSSPACYSLYLFCLGFYSSFFLLLPASFIMKSSVLSIIFTAYFISINILFFHTRWSYAS